MKRTISHYLGQMIMLGASAALIAACADKTPFAPGRYGPAKVQLSTLGRTDTNLAIATLRRVTGRYHNVNNAIADGFGLLHPCEDRPEEGPVGTVYVHMGRLLDGRIDPELPDALIYEPHRDGLKLVGVEFAIPKALSTDPIPPQFLGATFQSEDEFGVYGLHVWVWRDNPDGLFAETNPRVACGGV